MKMNFSRMDYLVILMGGLLGFAAYLAWAHNPPIYTGSLENAVYFDEPLNSKHVTMREAGQ